MLLTRIKAGEELEPRLGTAARPTVGELAEKISPGACGGAVQAEHGQVSTAAGIYTGAAAQK